MWLRLFKDLKLNYIKYDVELKKYNTFNVGGIADVIAFPSSIEELLVVLNFIKQYNNEIYAKTKKYHFRKWF